LDPEGYIFLSSHQSFAFAETINNLLWDSRRLTSSVAVTPLNLKESSTERQLPAGVLVYAKLA
jgi:hypothetical protein